MWFKNKTTIEPAEKHHIIFDINANTVHFYNDCPNLGNHLRMITNNEWTNNIIDFKQDTYHTCELCSKRNEKDLFKGIGEMICEIMAYSMAYSIENETD
jgi:hypothetical protein